MCLQMQQQATGTLRTAVELLQTDPRPWEMVVEIGKCYQEIYLKVASSYEVRSTNKIIKGLLANPPVPSLMIIIEPKVALGQYIPRFER